MTRAFWETPREVTHDEARQACRRLINSHFRNEDSARVSIPANPDRDDDLVLSSYIEQRERAAGADQERLVQALGAAISRRVWSEVEAAYAALRDYERNARWPA